MGFGSARCRARIRTSGGRFPLRFVAPLFVDVGTVNSNWIAGWKGLFQRPVQFAFKWIRLRVDASSPSLVCHEIPFVGIWACKRSARI